MSWRGPALAEDQRDLAAMLEAFATDRDVVLDDDVETVSGLVTELADLGVWTLGTAEDAGGGGADRATAVVAFEQLGRTWPALGWAAVQAHAAVDLIAGDPRCADLLGALHAGAAGVAVVDAGSPHVRLTWEGDRLAGAVDRVDAAHPAPYLLVLVDDASALLVAPAATSGTPLLRTGLGGAFTQSLEVDGDRAAVLELTGADVAPARRRLHLAAAVAAGIAGAASDAALEYASARRQFGDVLTAIPTVRQSLFGQASRTSLVLDAILATADDDLQSSAVLTAACDEAIDVAAAALQSHGGYGYLAEYAAERRLRDAVSLRAAVDTPRVALAMARRLVGLPALPSPLTKDAS